MKIGFIILAHENPESVGNVVASLNLGDTSHRVILHLDARLEGAQRKEFLSSVRNIDSGFEECTPVHCAWGDWSLAEAALAGIKKLKSGKKVDYVVLLSGSHVVLKAPAELERFLQENAKMDFIESVDPRIDPWVQGGPSIERFQYEFPYNFMAEREKFDNHFAEQRENGKTRDLPEGLRPRLGSQWWCLRWTTIEAITKELEFRPEIIEYFRNVWIPDESFFQTLVGSFIPNDEICSIPFVLHTLTPTGRPYAFFKDHADALAESGFFLARKVCSHSDGLRVAMAQRIEQDNVAPHASHPDQLKEELTAFRQNVKDAYQIPERPIVGHIADAYTSDFLALDKQVIILLVQGSDSMHERLYDLDFPSGFQFFGQCFMKDTVRFTDDMQEKFGLTHRSFETRDRFTAQLMSQMISSTDDFCVFAVDPDQDFESWRSLLNLTNHSIVLLPDEEQPFLTQETWVRRHQSVKNCLGVTDMASLYAFLIGLGRSGPFTQLARVYSANSERSLTTI